MTLPSFSKIVLVIEENHGYSQIIGSSNAPYINSLLGGAALFTNSHGGPDVPHPSFPNYMQLFSGSPQGLTNDSCPPPGQPFSAANLASAVIAAGKTFGGYAEDFPSSRTSCSNTTTAQTYAGRHVPWVWFSSVPANCCLDWNTAWPASSAGFAALPAVSIVTPNLAHDMHTYGGLPSSSPQLIINGDAWLKTHIDPYLTWAKSNNSLLILQWDEDNGTTGDTIPTIFAGANIKPGQYSEHITHYNVLATLCALTGATPMAGAASATVISDVWQAGGSGVPGTPTGLTVTAVTSTSVSLSWTAPTQGPVTGYDVWANGSKVASPTGTSVTVTGLTANTTYSITVDAFNANGTGNQTAAVQATTSSGGVVPPVVQVTQGSATGKTLTLTFANPVQYYHGVVIALAGYPNGVVSSITIGGVAGTFTSVRTSGGTSPVTEIWACEIISQAAQLSRTIVITTTTAGIAAWAYEIESPQQAAGQFNGVYGLQNVTTDKTAGNHSTGTAWSSGATATTVPGPEFAVGIGAVAASGTVTGPGSGGWANQPAITGVAGAVTFGAVSGYQVQAGGSAGAYTYSGSSANSGQWGGVAATFLLMPQGEAGWSGYVWQPEQAPPGGYTGITATFTMPALSLPADPSHGFSVWVGLGDATPQIGAYCFYNTGKPGNNSLFLWSFFDPGSEQWDATTYPAQAGDSMTLSITSDAQFFYMQMDNSTQGWSYTEQKSIQSVALESSAGMIMPKNLCEVIVEDEGGSGGILPNYGTITFTSVTVTPTPLGQPVPWAFVNQGITQLPGPYSGGSFTMHWVSET